MNWYRIGGARAARASARINPLGGVQQLGRHLEVAEIRVQPGSPGSPGSSRAVRRFQEVFVRG